MPKYGRVVLMDRSTLCVFGGSGRDTVPLFRAIALGSLRALQRLGIYPYRQGWRLSAPVARLSDRSARSFFIDQAFET